MLSESSFICFYLGSIDRSRIRRADLIKCTTAVDISGVIIVVLEIQKAAPQSTQFIEEHLVPMG